MSNCKKALITANMSGFLWKFELNNVRILQELGYEVHYASNINEKGYAFDLNQMRERGIIFHHIDIARSPFMFKMNLSALKEIIRIIDREKITLLHCHTPVGGLLGRLAGVLSKNRPRVIYTAHGFHFYKGAPIFNNVVYQLVERVLAHFTDVIILINEEDYMAAKTMHLKKNGRVYLVPGVGIDFSSFKPVSAAEKNVARHKIRIDEEAIFVLSVGELNINKNHKTVIMAMNAIIAMKELGDRVIYGICGDGYFRKDIQEFANNSGVGNKVLFFGYQYDIREYYAAADVTVFPSVREGLGMAGIESLAMGIPVIASDNRGTREYMRDGQNGFVFQAEDVNDCTRCIKRYFHLNPEQKKEMSEQCIKSVQRFSKDITGEIMKGIYSGIAEE